MSSNMAGIIFANVREDKIPELTSRRTLASVPFGGKYRLVDFPLSNMSNSGICNVGIIARSSFHSLLDHVGSGSAWDLSKRRSGLTILSPYGGHSFVNRIEALFHLHGYIEHLDEEYIVLSACDCVANFDYQKLFSAHKRTGADITLVYQNREVPASSEAPLVLYPDESGRVKKLLIKPPVEGKCSYATGTLLLKKDLLMKLVRSCMSANTLDFKQNLLQDNVDSLKIYGYEFTGYCAVIASIGDYYRSNMSLMKPENRDELFNHERPIYTKVRDDVPCRYGLTSKVTNSLVAQGCVVDGQVRNSVISKGVSIGKGARVDNCIIMQDTKIGENASLSYVIVDKDVVIRDNRTLMGYESYPIFIAKQTVV